MTETPVVLCFPPCWEVYARLRELEARLHAALVESGDPRVLGGAERWDAYPYYGGMPR